MKVQQAASKVIPQAQADFETLFQETAEKMRELISDFTGETYALMFIQQRLELCQEKYGKRAIVGLAIAFELGDCRSDLLHDFLSEWSEWFDPRTQYLCPEDWE